MSIVVEKLCHIFAKIFSDQLLWARMFEPFNIEDPIVIDDKLLPLAFHFIDIEEW